MVFIVRNIYYTVDSSTMSFPYNLYSRYKNLGYTRHALCVVLICKREDAEQDTKFPYA